MLKRALPIALGVLLGTILAWFVVQWLENPAGLPWSERQRALRGIAEVLRHVHEEYVDETKVSYEQLAEAAKRGVVAGLDPHSEVLRAADYRQLEEELSDEFGGIGVQIELRQEQVVVITPMAGTPGERAGLRRGDVLVAIDGKRLEKPRLDEVVAALRGEEKTPVRVRWSRPGETEEREAVLIRERIQAKSVPEVKLLPGDVGYIRIESFSEHTGEEFVAALNQLSGQGAVALILDLRNNPGGLLEAAVQVAEPFFRKGDLIVSTQGRQAADREEFRAAAPDEPLDSPTVILINAGSASAAEIVAGALKDRNKAVIVGERSFGKGSVQTVFPLRQGGGMRLTTARYFTPSGQTLHQKGITPHVEVVLTREEDENLALQLARPDITTDAEFRERFGQERIPDRALQTAREVLTGLVALRAKQAETPPPSP